MNNIPIFRYSVTIILIGFFAVFLGVYILLRSDRFRRRDSLVLSFLIIAASIYSSITNNFMIALRVIEGKHLLLKPIIFVFHYLKEILNDVITFPSFMANIIEDINDFVAKNIKCDTLDKPSEKKNQVKKARSCPRYSKNCSCNCQMDIRNTLSSELGKDILEMVELLKEAS